MFHVSSTVTFVHNTLHSGVASLFLPRPVLCIPFELIHSVTSISHTGSLSKLQPDSSARCARLRVNMLLILASTSHYPISPLLIQLLTHPRDLYQSSPHPHPHLLHIRLTRHERIRQPTIPTHVRPRTTLLEQSISIPPFPVINKWSIAYNNNLAAIITRRNAPLELADARYILTRRRHITQDREQRR
jgi:hypothetical protein